MTGLVDHTDHSATFDLGHGVTVTVPCKCGRDRWLVIHTTPEIVIVESSVPPKAGGAWTVKWDSKGLFTAEDVQ